MNKLKTSEFTAGLFREGTIFCHEHFNTSESAKTIVRT